MLLPVLVSQICIFLSWPMMRFFGTCWVGGKFNFRVLARDDRCWRPTKKNWILEGEDMFGIFCLKKKHKFSFFFDPLRVVHHHFRLTPLCYLSHRWITWRLPANDRLVITSEVILLEYVFYIWRNFNLISISLEKNSVWVTLNRT